MKDKYKITYRDSPRDMSNSFRCCTPNSVCSSWARKNKLKYHITVIEQSTAKDRRCSPTCDYHCVSITHRWTNTTIQNLNFWTHKSRYEPIRLLAFIADHYIERTLFAYMRYSYWRSVILHPMKWNHSKYRQQCSVNECKITSRILISREVHMELICESHWT